MSSDTSFRYCEGRIARTFGNQKSILYLALPPLRIATPAFLPALTNDEKEKAVGDWLHRLAQANAGISVGISRLSPFLKLSHFSRRGSETGSSLQD